MRITILLLTLLIASNSLATEGFFVRLHNSFTPVDAAAFFEKMGHGEVSAFESFKLVPNLYFLRTKSSESTRRLVDTMKNDKLVLYVAPNRLRTIATLPKKDKPPVASQAPAPIPKPAHDPVWKDDPKRSSNYATGNSGANRVWAKYTMGDPSIIIADLDTGIDYNHRDLAPNIWRNPGESGLDANGKAKESNGIDDDANGYVDDFLGWDFVNNRNLPWDDHGHGTHTAGIAAAEGGNGWGTSGVCPRCTIMPVKFIGADGSGDDLGAIHAIEYAVTNGARIMNCSWGGSEDSQALRDAFTAADSKGVMAVTAAGNDGRDINVWPAFPAKYDLPLQLTVAALYPVNVFIPSWSNYGNKTVHTSQVGSEVTSTFPGNRFETWSGTSMATPGVAGSAALIWSFRPDLTADQVKTLISHHVIADKGSMGQTIFRGRPDVLRIVKKLAERKP